VRVCTDETNFGEEPWGAATKSKSNRRSFRFAMRSVRMTPVGVNQEAGLKMVRRMVRFSA
jgi:hypothetical protein